MKSPILSYATSGILATAAENRSISVKPGLFDAGWENASTSYTLIGETSDGLIRCVFSSGHSQLRESSDISEVRMWTANELRAFIGTRLKYNNFSHTETEAGWETRIGFDGHSFDGQDESESEAIAKAVIAYLNGDGPIV